MTMAALQTTSLIHEEALDDDSSTGDEQENLEMLLGGLCFADIDGTAWDNQSQHDEDVVDDKQAETSLAAAPSTIPSTLQHSLPVYRKLSSERTDSVFAYAFYCDETGRISRPNVAVVDMESRGHGLVAVSRIPKGSVIFTEKAAVACPISNSRVRACQNCFRSLEPASSLSNCRGDGLPLQHLWPIPEFSFPNAEIDSSFVYDIHGRCQCRHCQTYFCSKHCQSDFMKRYASCCTLLAATNEAESSDEALAVRIFTESLVECRRTGKLGCSFVTGLCGDSADLTALEIGIMTKDQTYTLKVLYDKLVAVLNLTVDEQDALPLDYLERLVAVVARNGVNISTKSPFATYYSSLIHTVGRGSDRHNDMKLQLARSLGSEQLERGMDRLVNQKVRVDVAALFPLLARINHSCDPNAQVHGESFTDCHLDLIAMRDIVEGEEISISYLPFGPGYGQKNVIRRRHELQAKYLFHCECTRCRKESIF